eukprot:2662496-Rhodomonas_salina.1
MPFYRREQQKQQHALTQGTRPLNEKNKRRGGRAIHRNWSAGQRGGGWTSRARAERGRRRAELRKKRWSVLTASSTRTASAAGVKSEGRAIRGEG